MWIKAKAKMWIEAKAIFQGLNKFCCDSENEEAFNEFFKLLNCNVERLQRPLLNKVTNFLNHSNIPKRSLCFIKRSFIKYKKKFKTYFLLKII